MRKIVLLILLLTLLTITAGCAANGPKESGPATDEPAVSVNPSDAADDSPSPEQSAQDTALPSEEPPTGESPSTSQIPQPEGAPSPGQAPPDMPSETPGMPQDSLDVGYGLMFSDGIGSIQLGMTESELISLMGDADIKTDPEFWGADGLSHFSWTYTAQNVEVNLTEDPEKDHEAIVFSIRAESPCTLETKQGIKIGDTKEAALEAYENYYNAEDSEDFLEDGLVFGSIYGGIVMECENGLVKSIFIGAAAE
jgi:hypothetical protein